MPDDAYTFANTRTRLEDIVTQVRKKDTSLEKSLDLLEEGVRLANQCTELIDHADWAAADAPVVPDDASGEPAEPVGQSEAEDAAQLGGSASGATSDDAVAGDASLGADSDASGDQVVDDHADATDEAF